MSKKRPSKKNKKLTLEADEAGFAASLVPLVFVGLVGVSLGSLIAAQDQPPVKSKILVDWQQDQDKSEDPKPIAASMAKIPQFKREPIPLNSKNESTKIPEVIVAENIREESKVNREEAKTKPVAHPTPIPWSNYAVKAPALKGKIPIIIVIDDMGMNVDYTDQFAALKGPLTYAFLPYASYLDQQTKTVKAMGHELMLHLPMEPSRNGENPGENALIRDLPYEETIRRIDWNLKRFTGYVGVNNHMGSQYTASRSFMFPVLSEIKARDLMFLDSRTTANSVASGLSEELEIPTVSRDVFLDNVRTVEAILGQLNTVENIARKKGYAVAIGHPYRVTLQALKAWIPTLKHKEFVLWPLSAALLQKHQLKRSK